MTVQCGSEPLSPGISHEFGIRVVRHRILTRIYGTPLMPSLLRELNLLDTDILHGNFPSPYIAFTVAAASKIRKIPAILTWHNDLPAVTSGARFLIETHDRIILQKYINIYRRIISTSPHYAERSKILSTLSKRVTVVPNGVDCQRFHPTTRGNAITDKLRLDGKFVILFVGALTKWHGYKGLDVLLNATKRASQENPNLALIVVGDGELRQCYSLMSHKLAVERIVTFVGDIADEVLPQYYAACDVLVLPSRDMSEGFGLTLLEANATGKPVIASNVGGIPAVVKNGYNGILVPPNDTTALSRAVLSFVKDLRKAREMGLNGRRVAEDHDWTITAAKTEQVYRESATDH